MATISNMTVTDEGDYRKGVVPSDTTGTIVLNDGEVFDNFLIDVTSTNSRFQITADQSNWTVKNIGVTGVSDMRDTSGHTSIELEANGTCRVKNVYAGDGSANDDGAASSNGLLKLSSSSSGDLTVKGVYAAGWKGGAIDTASGHSGNVQIRRCFAQDNNHWNYKTGTSQQNLVYRCSAEYSSGLGDGRGIWEWDYTGSVVVSECNVAPGTDTAFWAGSGDAPNSGADIDVQDTQWQGTVAEPYGSVSFDQASLDMENGAATDNLPDGVVTGPVKGATGDTHNGTGLFGQGGVGSYETIVADGQTIQIEDGETWENKLIDVTQNPDAGIRIEAWADNWTIRNVGVKGVWEREIDGHEQLISARVNSADATGTIENLYFADGATDSTFPGITGIYVNAYHSGTLNIKNINIQDMPNNAIYASNPHGTGGGEVNISDSYASNCLSSHFRVGTDGSSITNSVATSGDRGVWVLQGNVDVTGCDLSAHAENRADGDIVAGSNTNTSDAYVTVTDTYFGKTAPGDHGINYPGTIDGTSVTSSPRRTAAYEVTGVPQTAEAAAGGASLFEIRTTSEVSNFEYTFTTNGEVTKGADAETTDTITDNDDGTWTVDGVVGDGYDDSFNVNGDILEFNPSPAPSGVSFYVDGEEVTFSNEGSGTVRSFVSVGRSFSSGGRSF